MFAISDTIITVNNKKNDFKHNINNAFECKGLIIVHIFDSYEKKGYIDTSEQPINNVYAIDTLGNISWNIRDILKRDELVTGIKKDADENVVISTFHGVAYIIDANIKQVVGHIVTK